MKSLILVALCLYSICQAFPVEENSQNGPVVFVNRVAEPEPEGEFHILPVQEDAPASGNAVPQQWWRNAGNDGGAAGNAGGAGHRGQRGGNGRKNLKAKIQAHKGQIKQYLLHVFKAFMPKEAVEKWFNLTREARQCITTAQNALGIFWIGGAINSEDDWISRLKTACPMASADIEAWHQECLAHRAEAQAKWTETFNKLPESVRNVITNLNETFEGLRKNGTFLARDKDAIKAAFLPILQQFIAISQPDWDQTVTVFPKLEIILGSNGNLTKEFFVMIRAAEEYLRTGTVAKETQQAVKDAQEAFKEYGMAQWKQWAPVLKEKLDNAQEQEFSPEAQSELESAVDEGLNTAEQHAPIAEAHILPASE